VVVVTPRDGVKLDADTLLTACKRYLPTYMLPGLIDIREDTLPRNPNGKIDRKMLARELRQIFMEIN